MRLLNTKSLEFGEFFDSDIPEYAILSHRWGDDEVLYKEFKKGKASEGTGLNKIREFCALAAQDGFGWIWIDTCCIDKRSSAELSEAINSMHRWYNQSAVCYVYLGDVCYSPSEVSILKDIHEKAAHLRYGFAGPPAFSIFHKWNALKQKFRNSSWFRRGWTLQELLAPVDIKFFDKRWTLIGDGQQLKDDISEITGITIDHLSYNLYVFASIAQKMSWASRRETSRGEDLAYCLLGLFDINMPLLYGEGADKAFYRLQREILRSSNDESIFAWTAPETFSGLLAAHPRYFGNSGDFIPFPRPTQTRPHYTITNRGLQMPILSSDVPLGYAFTLTMHLYCSRASRAGNLEENGASKCQAVVLHLSRYGDSYVRVDCDSLLCTLEEPHSLLRAKDDADNDSSLLAKDDPDSSCAIYVRIEDRGRYNEKYIKSKCH
ncbi:MAG: hypothetical protein OHK93_008374 [Ramalina farinacea]|uniref:HET-domain-containing protein n=1 Tax=Ramalina farinacea TaxID=258253 RepID=A0AA43QMA8_9LECA|nr:hypothetical protein [Ramalina farinacea]